MAKLCHSVTLPDDYMTFQFAEWQSFFPLCTSRKIRVKDQQFTCTPKIEVQENDYGDVIHIPFIDLVLRTFINSSSNT